MPPDEPSEDKNDNEDQDEGEVEAPKSGKAKGKEKELPPEEPPKENKNDQDDHEEASEPPKPKKCVRWADYEQFENYLDTVPRRPPYLHGVTQIKKWEEKQKELPHLDCVEEVLKVALEVLKGRDIELYDDQTERIVEGLEGEARSSPEYKTFKSYQENPGSAINGKYTWKLHDPKLRAKLREQAEDEIGLINHKLRTGEWVQDMREGKPFSVMDAVMRMDELRDSIKLMDTISQYDTLPPQKPS